MKKMMNALLAMMLLLLLSACEKINNRLDNLEDRVSKLEALCSQMNTNVASLQTIVEVLQTGDYITSVQALVENGVEVGYRITFAKAGDIMLYHGQDGKDGKDAQENAMPMPPKVGVKQASDGAWYYTVDGQWMHDASGNTVKAYSQGDDGSGVRLQFRIVDGHWEVSFDNGKTWMLFDYGASGGEGSDDSDDGSNDEQEACGAIFEKVYEADGYMVFELKDGSIYRIPMVDGNRLDIVFSVEQGVAIVPGTTLKVEYQVLGAEGDVLVRAVSMTFEYGFGLTSVVKPIDNESGYLYIAYPKWLDENFSEIIEDEDNDGFVDAEMGFAASDSVTVNEMRNTIFSVLVSVSDSEGHSVLKSLNVDRGQIASVTNAYLVSAKGGLVEATINTNLHDYEIVMRESDKQWLSLSPDTRASMRSDVLSFTAAENTGENFRSAPIQLRNELGMLLENFTIVQRSASADTDIVFADDIVKQICVERYDSNGDGELSYEEAAMVSDVKGLFERGYAWITSFDEFQHFVSVTHLPEELFANCERLESVKLPESLVHIGNNAFSGCASLDTIVIPEGVEGFDEDEGYEYGETLFRNCSSLVSVTLPSSWTSLPAGCFWGCTSLETVVIPEGVSGIPRYCFSGCTALKQVLHATPFKRIGSEAFYSCASLTSFDLSGLAEDEVELYPGENNGLYRSSLERGAFAYSGLTSVVIPASVKEIEYEVFEGCDSLRSISLHDDIVRIGEEAFAGTAIRTIDLPEKLLEIGAGAFASCKYLEGELIEGTDVKAVTIPAGVQSLGFGYYDYDAIFDCCPNLKAVRMLSTLPPPADSYALRASSESWYDEDDNRIELKAEDLKVYVPEASYSLYQEEGWDVYNLLPFEWAGFNLSLNYEITDAAYYPYYDADWNLVDEFGFLRYFEIEGDQAKVNELYYIGYQIRAKDRWDDYFFESTWYFNTLNLDSISDNSKWFYINKEYLHDDYEYRSPMYISTDNEDEEWSIRLYAVTNSGAVIYFEDQPITLKYDKQPKFTYISAEYLGCEPDTVEVGRTNAKFKCNYELEGSYWMRSIQTQLTNGVTNGFRLNTGPFADSDGWSRNYIHWFYDSTPSVHSVYEEIELKNGQTIYSTNHMHITGTDSTDIAISIVDGLPAEMSTLATRSATQGEAWGTATAGAPILLRDTPRMSARRDERELMQSTNEAIRR